MPGGCEGRFAMHPSIELATHQSIHSQSSTYPSRAGTMGYIPPEAMRRTSGVEVSGDVSKKWDVYSFAVLMCYTLSGTPPFAGMPDAQIMMMVAFVRKRPSIPAHVDADPEHPVFKQMIQSGVQFLLKSSVVEQTNQQ